MPRVHCLNVSPGDCTIIQHASERVTILDICDGNLQVDLQKAIQELVVANTVRGNFRMCEKPTNPLSYLNSIGITEIWRFILSHPDCDHMDGLAPLLETFTVNNFWDSGSRRTKPDFSASPYKEEDWDTYFQIIEGKNNTINVVKCIENANFKYANQNEDGSRGSDGLYILAPNENLLCDPNENDDVNEGTYVILYKSIGGKILLPGDAHDDSWEFVATNHTSDIENCAFLLAPHHGRDSGRSYDFLDKAQPKLTLIGCAPSDQIDYDQWHRRGLQFITSNQAGNVVLEIASAGIDVYVENDRFAQKKSSYSHIKNEQGYNFIMSLRS